MLKLKSSREIEAMRKAGLVVWEAHQIAKRLVRPGITTGEIDQAVETFFEEQNVVTCSRVFQDEFLFRLCVAYRLMMKSYMEFPVPESWWRVYHQH